MGNLRVSEDSVSGRGLSRSGCCMESVETMYEDDEVGEVVRKAWLDGVSEFEKEKGERRNNVLNFVEER